MQTQTQEKPRATRIEVRKFKIVHPRLIGTEENQRYVFASPEDPQVVELPATIDVETGQPIDRTLFPLDAQVEAQFLKPHYAPPASAGQHLQQSLRIPEAKIAPSNPVEREEPAKGKRPSDTKQF